MLSLGHLDTCTYSVASTYYLESEHQWLEERNLAWVSQIAVLSDMCLLLCLSVGPVSWFSYYSLVYTTHLPRPSLSVPSRVAHHALRLLGP